MTEARYEFASPAWLAAIGALVAERLADVDLSGVTFSFSEEFTDPPAHLRRPGHDTVGWHYRITDGVLEIGGEPVDADLKVVADYATILPLSRTVLEGDDGAARAAAAVVAEAEAAGRYRREGRPPRWPQLAGLAGVHDDIARLTS